MNAQQTYTSWLNSPIIDGDTKELLGFFSPSEIEECFSSYLNFGTAGLRGILGPGTNRMNLYTVAHASQAVAELILREPDGAKKGAVIAYDSRIMSPEFAKRTAEVFAANGIKTYLFESLRPTPELSFAVRELGCTAGINITASHNPSQYNGYKVYWSDGAQISLQQADKIASVMNQNDVFFAKLPTKEEYESNVTILGEEFDEKYLSAILKAQITPEVCKRQSDLPIVYTPFHGTGLRLVPEVLKRAGFTNVIPVPSQMDPNGHFPTVISPNPEHIEGFASAMHIAKEKGAELIIGTDPDADRIGVLVRNKEGEFEVLTGNQTGAILLEYIVSSNKAKGTLPKNGAMVKTVVTSELGAEICKKEGIAVFNVLTEFKFIGEKIEQFNASGEYKYIFGYEESYGSLIGEHARDKDAVVAALMVAEAAAFYKEKGLTLYDLLMQLFEKHGYFREKTVDILIKGASPLKLMAEKMASLRQEYPEKVCGYKVTEVLDFSQGLWGLPKSNMLYYKLEDGTVLVIRPSGTEPKIKVYVMTKGENNAEAEKKLWSFVEEFGEYVKK